MIKEQLFNDLFNKIPQNSKIAIMGAGIVGEKIFSDIKKHRNDVEIICFIDSFKNGSLGETPIVPFEDLETIKHKIDLIVFSTRKNMTYNVELIRYFDIPLIPETIFLERHYRDEKKLYSDENFDEIIGMFQDNDDKKIFELVFRARINKNNEELSHYVLNEHNVSLNTTIRNFYKQYLDKINLGEIKTAYDLGFFNGCNFLAWDKNMQNLQKVYAFEPIYEISKHSFMDKLIQKTEKVEIVPFATADKDGEVTFVLNKKYPSGSYATELSSKSSIKHCDEYEHKVPVTSIDNYILKNNIIPPDLIKMDIEGAEMPALIGALETIKKYRPQLAISIYHSDEDFINIPLFLKKVLNNYVFKIGHYSYNQWETVFYAIPEEIA